jgi:hypothetical protein
MRSLKELNYFKITLQQFGDLNFLGLLEKAVPQKPTGIGFRNVAV